MKAAIIDTSGKLPRFGEFEAASPAPGETLIDVVAAAIKPLDRAIAAGTHYSSPKALPVVCGTDGVGRDPSGALVYFNVLRRPFGAMAQQAPASWTVPLPQGLEPAAAAAVVNPALAAWLPLQWRAGMKAGDTVMILGATGAAGHMAVRAARLLGAGRIIAAGRQTDVLAKLDADAHIDLTLPDHELSNRFEQETTGGLDIIVDYLWGRPIELLLPALAKSDLSADPAARGVRLVSVGEMAGRTVSLPSQILRASWLQIMGSGTGNFPPVARLQEIVSDILARTAAGELEIAAECVPLSEVARMWTSPDSAGKRNVLTANE